MNDMLPSIHCIFSFKGGVGKTTITANLAATLAAQGWRILIVDGDPQANITGFMTRYGQQTLHNEYFQPDQDEYVPPADRDPQPTLQRSDSQWWRSGCPGFLEPHREEADVMPVGGVGEPGLDVAEFLRLVRTPGGDFDTLRSPTILNGYRKLGIIKGTPHIVDQEKVANVEQQGPDILGRLRKGLHQMGRGFDLVLIDLPPAISDLNKLFLTSSDYIIMPVACDAYSGDTLWQMFQGDRESVLGKMSKYMTKASTMQDGINKKVAGGHQDPISGDFIANFERSIGIFPLLMNMCMKGRAYQTMHRNATMWYNGYKSFLEDVTLPSGFKWVNDACRVVGAFNVSVALAKRQVEKLPVVLSKSLTQADMTLRDSFLALSTMLVVTVEKQLQNSNPQLMAICKAHSGTHGRSATIVSGCMNQVPHFREAPYKMPAEMKRDKLDNMLIELVEALVYSSRKYTQSIPRSGKKKKTLTLRELLFEQTIEERDVTEHMGALSSTVNGHRLIYKDGHIDKDAEVDFAIECKGKVVAKVEMKMIKAKITADKDFGAKDLRSQMNAVYTSGSPVNQSLKGIYGIVAEHVEGSDRGMFGDVKQIALFKWTKLKSEDTYRPVVFCFIPIWRPSASAGASSSSASSSADGKKVEKKKRRLDDDNQEKPKGKKQKMPK